MSLNLTLHWRLLLVSSPSCSAGTKRVRFPCRSLSPPPSNLIAPSPAWGRYSRSDQSRGSGVQKRRGAYGALAAAADRRQSWCHTCPRQGRWRPTPRFCGAAGAGGVSIFETCDSAAAKQRPKTRTRRRYIAARAALPLCT